MGKLRRLMDLVGAVPRSVWFNFRWLPWEQALTLPVWIAPNVRVKSMWRGGMVLADARFNSCHIGFHCADAVDCYGVHTIVCVKPGGRWLVESGLHVGRGAIVNVNSEGVLRTGRNFAVSGTTGIVCSKSVSIGDDVQFSWNSLVMDSDAHRVYDVDGKWVNEPRDVIIGSKVWVAANVTIMKGSVIGDNCVVACNSMVNRAIGESDCVIAGVPARKVKDIWGWEI